MLPHVLGELNPLEHELVGLAWAGAAVLVDEPPVVVLKFFDFEEKSDFFSLEILRNATW